MHRVALLLVGLVLLAGCGAGSGSTDEPKATKATKVDLTYSAGGAVKKQSLECPAGSEGAALSCELLEKLPASVFEPVPGSTACTMIYGGPEIGTIKGQVNGRSVDATFNRTNGCEIDRFKQVEQLFAEMAGN